MGQCCCGPSKVSLNQPEPLDEPKYEEQAIPKAYERRKTGEPHQKASDLQLALSFSPEHRPARQDEPPPIPSAKGTGMDMSKNGPAVNSGEDNSAQYEEIKWRGTTYMMTDSDADTFRPGYLNRTDALTNTQAMSSHVSESWT
jgi:hypothetical protein